MKQTSDELKKYKEVKRGFLRNGEEVQYIVIQKATDGRLAQVFVGEWVTTNAVDELVSQAQIYQQEQKQLAENEKQVQEKHFAEVIKDLADDFKMLERRLELANIEIKYIKGELTEEEYVALKEGKI
jgi:hypothetical protein